MNRDPSAEREPLTCRAMSILRAVRDGRAELALSCEPDLYVDGIPCCDQATARTLGKLGLISAARPGRIGDLIPAVVTQDGHRALGTSPSQIAG